MNSAKYSHLKEDMEQSFSKNKSFQHQSASYDEDQIPPNWKFAEDHMKARQTGPELNNEEQSKLGLEENTCDCCGFNVNRKLLPITCDTISLSFLGAGYPLFFEYIKYSIQVLVLIFVVSGGFNLYTNYNSNDCQSLQQIEANLQDQFPQDSVAVITQMASQKYHSTKTCVNEVFLNLSVANKLSNTYMLTIQQWLNLASIIGVILLLQYFRKQTREINNKVDEAVISPSDYYVIVKHIVTDQEFNSKGQTGYPQLNPTNYKQVIFDLFNDLHLKDGEKLITTKVTKVSLCYDLTELNATISRIDSLLSQKAGKLQRISNPNISQDQSILQSELQILQAQLQKEYQIKQQQEDSMQGKQNGMSDKFCGIAFVAFELEEQKQAVIKLNAFADEGGHCFGLFSQRYRQLRNQHVDLNSSKINYRGKQLVVEQAPEPSDVIWENQPTSTLNKFIRRCIVLLITCGILVGSFKLILLMNQWQLTYIASSNAQASQGQENSYNLYFAMLIGKAISIVIVCINILLEIVIGFLSVAEKFSTTTKQNISIASKNSLAQFANVGLVLFCVSYLYAHNIIGLGGLILNVSVLFIMNAILPPIKLAVNNAFLIKWALRTFFRKYSNRFFITQKFAQKLYEHPPFSIASYYSQINVALFFAAFYAPVIPLGVVLAIIYLSLYYWMLKYTLLRKSIVLSTQSAELAVEMIEMLELVIIIYPLSNFLFNIILKNDNDYFSQMSILTMVGFFLGVLNAILPMQQLNEKWFPIKPSQDEVVIFSQAQLQFDTDYDLINPATCRKAKQDWVQQNEQQALLNQSHSNQNLYK